MFYVMLRTTRTHSSWDTLDEAVAKADHLRGIGVWCLILDDAGSIVYTPEGRRASDHK